MLEILGEVIYTFAEDPEGPPAELLEIFVGNPRAGYRLDPPPLPPSAATAASRLAHSQSAPSTPSARPKSKRGLLARDSSLRLPPPDPETSGVDPVPDLDRPLICAFNFPAVALTVGRERWHEVSGYYAQLAKEYVFTRAELTEGANVLSQFQRQVNAKKVGKVRRTIAASLGEMARILGEDITHEQLLPIFWEALYARPPAASVPMSGESRFSATSGQSGGVGADQNATPFGLSRLGSGKASPPNMTATSATPFATVSAVGVSAHNLVTAAAEAEAEDARTKMLECLVLFVKHLGSRERVEVARGLETAWKDHVKGWREREVFARTFGGLCEPGALGYDSSESSTSTSGPETMRALIMLALTDNVAAVRDEAIAQLPACFEGLDVDHTIVGKKLREDVLDLARTGSFRRRATYVKCLQALVLSERWGKHELARSDIWDMLQRLGTDSITDVRIGAARLTSLIAYQHYPTRRYPPGLLSLIRTLRNDKSPEVSSFVRFLVVAVPLPPTPGHAFSPTPRHQSAAVNDDQADPLSLADFQQPMVLPVLREPVASPFATFSNPPFFGEVTSPSLSTDGGEEYFDAFDSFPFQPMLAAVSEDAALASSGSPAHGQTATEHDVHSSVAPTPHLVGSGAPALTTQDAEEDEDPAPPRAERPPIYRLWSY
ncbi:hypothetical protein DL93DRAFT_2084755 [Clavulina sp. PMI_390]|nr:hypothetical protein DL93DRAFT_2084755 [Clavulina sp. PMI_390]